MSRRQLLTFGLVLAGLAAATWAFYRTLESSREETLPSLPWFALAFALAVVWLVIAGRMWIALFDGDGDPTVLAGGLYLSQLAKYVPGGAALQVASQVALARDEDISLARASIAYPVVALVTVVSSTTIAGGLSVVDSAIPNGVRWLVLLGLLSPALLLRRLTVAVFDRGRRIVKRIPASDLIPAQRAIWCSFAWSLPMMLATSVAFAALLHPLEPDVPVATATIAFAAAWVVGFLVIPVPAGFGVREGVLVLILGSVAPGALVAASLAHRMVTITAEVTMIGANRGARSLTRSTLTDDTGGDSALPES